MLDAVAVNHNASESILAHAREVESCKGTVMLVLALGNLTQKYVFQDVAESQHTLDPPFLVDDDKTMDAGFANRVEDGSKVVVG